MMRFFSSTQTSATPAKKDGEEDTKDAALSSGSIPNNPEVDKAMASHIKKMDNNIRRKLHGTGAQYNMKIVIRGERGVGKTMLWRRLQGLDFEEKYTPTPEIQATTINNWVYRASQEVVKVEVWDVVDRGFARGAVGRLPDGGSLEDAVAGLPSEESTVRGGRSIAVLDAGVVNVYQGANAVIFLVDPYRPETLDMVEEKLAETPVKLPAVVLLNFRDKRDKDNESKNAVREDKGRVASGQRVGPATQARRAREVTPPSTPAAADQDKSTPAVNGDGDPPTPPHPSSRREDVAGDMSGDVSRGDKGKGRPAEGEVVQASAVEEESEDGQASEREKERRRQAETERGPVTLEEARAMVDRVTRGDEEEGRGSGRLVSLFDCSMKNCFGLRVLYTYLNVPFLQLKQQTLFQQAKLAGEQLEKEVRELEGFIGGHSYENYMQHLQYSNIDPTAGRSTPAGASGRPNTASKLSTFGVGDSSSERAASREGGSVRDKEREKKKRTKKHHQHQHQRQHHHDHKDRGGDKSHTSKKKERHHKEGKGRRRSGSREGGMEGQGSRQGSYQDRLEVDGEDEDEVVEYEGKVEDPKEFAPLTKKSATEELDEFLGESSEPASDDVAGRDRRKIAKAINPEALAAAAQHRDEESDSDEMPLPGGSRLKRVTLPVKSSVRSRRLSLQESEGDASGHRGSSNPAAGDRAAREEPRGVVAVDAVSAGAGADKRRLATVHGSGERGVHDRRAVPSCDAEEDSGARGGSIHASTPKLEDAGMKRRTGTEIAATGAGSTGGGVGDGSEKERRLDGGPGEGRDDETNRKSKAREEHRKEEAEAEDVSGVEDARSRDGNGDEGDQGTCKGTRQGTADDGGVAGEEGLTEGKGDAEPESQDPAQLGAKESSMGRSVGGDDGAEIERSVDGAGNDGEVRDGAIRDGVSEMTDKPRGEEEGEDEAEDAGAGAADVPEEVEEDDAVRDVEESCRPPAEQSFGRGDAEGDEGQDQGQDGRGVSVEMDKALDAEASIQEETTTETTTETEKQQKQEAEESIPGSRQGTDATDEEEDSARTDQRDESQETSPGEETETMRPGDAGQREGGSVGATGDTRNEVEETNVDERQGRVVARDDEEDGDLPEDLEESARHDLAGIQPDAARDDPLSTFTPGLDKSAGEGDFFAEGASSDEGSDLRKEPTGAGRRSPDLNDNRAGEENGRRESRAHDPGVDDDTSHGYDKDQADIQDPPSPRFVSSTFRSGRDRDSASTMSPARAWQETARSSASQTKRAGASTGGMSEAARAAVAAALASAEAAGSGSPSRSSRRKSDDVKAKKRKSEKRGHKGRRQKEVDVLSGDGDRDDLETAERRSSRKGERHHHHHRKTAV